MPPCPLNAALRMLYSVIVWFFKIVSWNSSLHQMMFAPLLEPFLLSSNKTSVAHVVIQK